ncbi:hypothetical protein APK09_02 [Acinetobacter phage APK09]|uniref:Uncharacterized protein n=1 Tax=Acinetobacter phage APK09 TaxID=2873387 RepID=A0AAE8XKF8_9CAUD|nr:hypothetical protein APK09_02 [Acinetobacter phage APK09]
MNLLITVEDINKAIASISKRGKQLDNDIHVAGVSCLKHCDAHGDSTLLDKLVQAMPKGSRKAAFCEWALAYGNVRMLNRENKADKSAIEQGRLFAKDKSKTYDEAGAIANHWVDFKPEPDLLTTFDVHAQVAALISKYNKAINKGVDIEGKADAAKELRTLLSQLEVEA